MRSLLGGVAIVALCHAVAFTLLASYGALDIDRSRTLYVSKLDDIAGVYHLTKRSLCIDGSSTKTGADPRAILESRYQIGHITPLIW
jgi:hypothetical protein